MSDQAAIDWLIETHVGTGNGSSNGNGNGASTHGDWDSDGDNDELLAILREDPGFATLYDGDHDGEDHSSLDWALVCRVAELTGDPDRIEAIWQDSALWREEGRGGKSRGYHARTIGNALSVAAAERWTPNINVVVEPADEANDLDETDHRPSPDGLPDYPPNVFTGIARAQFDEMVRGGIPAAFAGAAILCAAAAMLGNSSRIDLDGMVQYPGIWAPIVGGVSSAKTPALTVAMSPAWDINARLASEYQTELADWSTAPKDERGDRPTRRSLTVQDVTIESLARTLDKLHGSVSVVTDELAGFLQGLGQYKNGHSGDRDRVLSLWSQSPWEYTRVGSGGAAYNSVEIYIPKPVVTVCGTLQFERVGLLGSGSDGLRARWLLHAANPVPPTNSPARTLDEWRDLIEELHATRWDTVIEERTWTLTDDASSRFYEQRSAWATRSRELGQTPEGAALGKADTQCMRVALVLAELDRPGTIQGLVSLDVIERAISVVNFSVACWADQAETETLNLTYKDPKLNEAVDKMRAWLRARGWVKERELRRNCVAGARTKDAQAELLARYRETYPDKYNPDEGAYRA